MLFCHSVSSFLSLFQSIARLNYLPAVSDDSAFLDRGGVVRHHDVGFEGESRGSVCECLRVISRRVGAYSFDFFIELKQLVESASRLKRSYLLEVFAFKK
jgi:hypothetical protein